MLGEPVTVVVGRLAPLLLRGLAETLADDHRVRVFGLDLPSAALEDAVKRSVPSVVILDDEAIEHSLLERLKSRRPAPAVLVFARNEPTLYPTMLAAVGAISLARDATPDDLTTAVQLAAAERHPHTTRLVERRLLSKVSLLTDRQRDVLKCIVEGRTHPEIASRLHITVETARSHTRHVRRKLEVRSNRELFGSTFLIQTAD